MVSVEMSRVIAVLKFEEQKNCFGLLVKPMSFALGRSKSLLFLTQEEDSLSQSAVIFCSK